MRRVFERLLGILAECWVMFFGTTGVVVLAYHSISESPWTHAVSSESFREQLDWLSRYAIVVSLADAERPHARSRQPYVAISFDDGYADWVTNAMPVLNEFGFPATFFVTTSFQLVTSQPQIGLQYATPDDICVLSRAGFEIGSHSRTHVDLSVASDTDAQSEIIGSKDELEDLITAPIIRMSYPKGRYRPELFPILTSAGYVSAYAGHGAVRSTSACFVLPRVPTSGKLPLWRFKGRIFRALVSK